MVAAEIFEAIAGVKDVICCEDRIDEGTDRYVDRHDNTEWENKLALPKYVIKRRILIFVTVLVLYDVISDIANAGVTGSSIRNLSVEELREEARLGGDMGCAKLTTSTSKEVLEEFSEGLTTANNGQIAFAFFGTLSAIFNLFVIWTDWQRERKEEEERMEAEKDKAQTTICGTLESPGEEDELPDRLPGDAEDQTESLIAAGNPMDEVDRQVIRDGDGSVIVTAEPRATSGLLERTASAVTAIPSSLPGSPVLETLTDVRPLLTDDALSAPPATTVTAPGQIKDKLTGYLSSAKDRAGHLYTAIRNRLHGLTPAVDAELGSCTEAAADGVQSVLSPSIDMAETTLENPTITDAAEIITSTETNGGGNATGPISPVTAVHHSLAAATPTPVPTPTSPAAVAGAGIQQHIMSRPQSIAISHPPPAPPAYRQRVRRPLSTPVTLEQVTSSSQHIPPVTAAAATAALSQPVIHASSNSQPPPRSISEPGPPPVPPHRQLSQPSAPSPREPAAQSAPTRSLPPPPHLDRATASLPAGVGQVPSQLQPQMTGPISVSVLAKKPYPVQKGWASAVSLQQVPGQPALDMPVGAQPTPLPSTASSGPSPIIDTAMPMTVPAVPMATTVVQVPSSAARQGTTWLRKTTSGELSPVGVTTVMPTNPLQVTPPDQVLAQPPNLSLSQNPNTRIPFPIMEAAPSTVVFSSGRPGGFQYKAYGQPGVAVTQQSLPGNVIITTPNSAVSVQQGSGTTPLVSRDKLEAAKTWTTQSKLGKAFKGSAFMDHPYLVLASFATIIFEDFPMTAINLYLLRHTCRSVKPTVIMASLGTFVSSSAVLWVTALHFAYNVSPFKLMFGALRYNVFPASDPKPDKWRYPKKTLLYSVIVVVVTVGMVLVWSIFVFILGLALAAAACLCVCGACKAMDSDRKKGDRGKEECEACAAILYKAANFFILKHPGEGIRSFVLVITFFIWLSNLIVFLNAVNLLELDTADIVLNDIPL